MNYRISSGMTITYYGIKRFLTCLLIGPLDHAPSDDFPPRRIDMPSLAPLNFSCGKLMLNRSFGFGTTVNEIETICITMFCRHADKALREYELARIALTEFTKDPQAVGRFIAATDHMENCVQAIEAVGHSVERLGKHHTAKKSAFTSRPLFKTIDEMRNHVAHNTKNILGGDIQDIPMTLTILQDRIKLAQLEVTYKDLADLLSEINQYALDLSVYHHQAKPN